MEASMNSIIRLVAVVAGLVLMLHLSPSWGQPPDPTGSDVTVISQKASPQEFLKRFHHPEGQRLVLRPSRGGRAGPGPLAQVITAKYADHVSFHRQVDIFAVMFPHS
jgi:hypothetical protein